MDRMSGKIIRCLLEADGYITTAVLSEMTGMSISSIKHHSNWIREKLREYGITLQSTPKKGFSLIATDEERAKAVQMLEEEENRHSESHIYRKVYILDTLFDFKANYTIQLFSEELDVSRNTIQKDLEQIGEQLLHLNVEIKRVRKQGVVLSGNEFHIRQAIIEHNNSRYWNWKPDILLEIADGFDKRVSKKAYTYLASTYMEADLLAFQKLLCEAEEALELVLDDISFCRLLEYMAIMRRRISGRDMIRKMPAERELPDLPVHFTEVAEAIIRKLLPKLEKPLPLEARYLAVFLFVSHTCDKTNDRRSVSYRRITVNYLRSLEEVLEMRRLSQDAELIHALSTLFHQVQFREYYQILVWNELHRDIQKQLSGLYAVCMANLAVVEEEIGTILRQDDVAWVVLLIHNFMTDIKNQYRVLFLHATDRHTALYNKRKLESEIPQINIVESMHFMEYMQHPPKLALMGADARGAECVDRNNSTDHTDDRQMIHVVEDAKASDEEWLIVSTVPMGNKHVLPSAHIIEVTKHIYNSDIHHIKEQLAALEERKEDHVRNEFAASVFQKELVISELNTRTKEDAILQICSMMQAYGYVEEGFVGQVLKREGLCPTSIGRGIAIPHHYGSHIMKSGIAVARLKHRVIWQKDEKVSLIFLIASQITDSDRTRMIFRYLYDLIEDSDRIKKVTDSQSAEEILQNILILS